MNLLCKEHGEEIFGVSIIEKMVLEFSYFDKLTQNNETFPLYKNSYIFSKLGSCRITEQVMAMGPKCAPI